MADFFQIRERAVLNKRNIKDKKALQKAYDLLLKKEKQYKSNSNYVNLVNRLYHSIDDFDAGNMDNQAYNELKKDIKKVLGNDSKQIIESLDEKYTGSLSDFKREFENEVEKLGFSPKVIKKISKKGKGFEVRVASYMKTSATFDRAASKIGATVSSFKKGGGVNIMMIESLNEMKMKDIVRKHKRELQKAKKTGNLELSKKAEDDLQSWVFDNEPSIGDDPDDFIDWLDDNLDDMLKGRIREEKAVEQKGKGTNAVFKRGDTVSLLSFDRTKRGRAKVKGVTGARPNKFGIEHHYITDRGTFTDMEVEGTKAYRLRFKGNTEQEVMKFMRSRVLYK